MRPLILIFLLMTAACNRPPADEVSYDPQIASVTNQGTAIYRLNCRNGLVAECHKVAIDQCAQVQHNVRVITHFVSGSQVKQITFYCSAGPQQLVPNNITFNSA